MAIRRNHPPDAEISSLNDENRRFGSNRRGLTAKEIIKIFGQLILLIGVITMAVYVIIENLLRRPCDQEEFHSPPIIERNGILELTWDSLPTAIRTVANLAIIEHNSQCGPLSISTLQPLRCDYLTLAVMPHAAFSFRHTCGSIVDEKRSEMPTNSSVQSPCFGIRWIANRLDTYHGPFADLHEVKRWFDSITAEEYVGCLGKSSKHISSPPQNQTL
ncbi:hypothetical protein M3Y98_01031000 [Aphelenchoides besseyi]|nr:hypothetical protein M3Y98_01031000 [Aphelenchoides besseyi]